MMDEYLIEHMMQREEEKLQAAISDRGALAPNQKYATAAESPYQECEDCGDVIETFRMLCGLPRCTACQRKEEIRRKHFGI